jgi:Aspartyl protease
MPQFTASLTGEGLELLVIVGLCSADRKKLQAAGLPVPPHQVVTGIIDTGSNCCSISARVASALGIVPLRRTFTQTAGGTVPTTLYKVSFLIPRLGSTTEFLAVVDSWTVSELGPFVTGFEALVGRDLLAQLLLVLNGPRNEYALAG